jgi:hypothetical protein
MQFLVPWNIFEGFRHAVIRLFSMVFLMDLYSHDMKENWNISTFKEFLIFAPKNTTGGLETEI